MPTFLGGSMTEDEFRRGPTVNQDREWQRLRRVEAAAKALVAAWDQAESSEPELEALRKAVWPEESGE